MKIKNKCKKTPSIYYNFIFVSKYFFCCIFSLLICIANDKNILSDLNHMIYSQALIIKIGEPGSLPTLGLNSSFLKETLQTAIYESSDNIFRPTF